MENLPIFKDINKEKMFIINQYNYGDPRFIITIDTTKGTGSSFTLPTRSGYSYNCTVDWGDSSTSEITAYNDADITHTYASGGVYQIKISGTFQAWYFNNGGDKLKLTKIDNWGTVGFMSLEAAFYGCTNLLSIPNSSIGNANIASFKFTFCNCNKLASSIPTDLFKYNTKVNATGAFYSTFQGCTALTGSIPADLFRYCTLVNYQAFYSTFAGCTGLTSIPVDLFRYNTSAATAAFQSTFAGCTGLTSIPVDLFRYNTNATGAAFYGTFNGCTGLTGNIPDDLFYYNSLVTRYDSTFQNCRNLVLPARLFNLSNLSIVTSFNSFMQAASTGYSNTGTIQDIWNYATGATSTNAFLNQTAISNYSSIPNGWKGL